MNRRVAGGLRIAACLAGALWPWLASAEGAVRVLECRALRACDGAGRCAAAAERVDFRMEPLEAGPDGAGRYALSYGDTEATMQALAFSGPFVWVAGERRHTLLASSDSEFLWHRLELGAAPAASILFMRCELRQ